MDSPASEHSVDINHGFKTVSIRHGASLFSGLARHGILMPSACGGNARCGACKIKTLDGCAGAALPQEAALLSEQERRLGMRLSCQVKVETDLSVEIPPEVFSIKQFSGTLIEKQPLTYDIFKLRIALVKPESISFIAGQYLQIRSQPFQGREAVVRAFSIASTPSDTRHVEVMARRVPNGICTAWIFDGLKQGDKVYFTAPYGNFRLSGTKSPALFIAGGSGMGPMWSLLHTMKETGVERRVSFFFGAQSRRDLFLVDELYAMEKELPGFSFVPALSNEQPGGDWKGQRGLITEVVARHCLDCSGHEAYLCGSPGMIEACKKVLLSRNMREENIFYDKF